MHDLFVVFIRLLDNETLMQSIQSTETVQGASPWRKIAYSITHPAYLMPQEPKCINLCVDCCTLLQPLNYAVLMHDLFVVFIRLLDNETHAEHTVNENGTSRTSKADN